MEWLIFTIAENKHNIKACAELHREVMLWLFPVVVRSSLLVFSIYCNDFQQKMFCVHMFSYHTFMDLLLL